MIDSRNNDWRQHAWLLLAFIGLLTTYLYPFSFDNNTYQGMAWQLVEKGKLQYIGTWDQNFPAIVYLHSLGILLFGNSVAAFRTLDLLLMSALLFVLYRVTARYFTREAAVFATLAYLAFYLCSGKNMLGQRDVYAGGLIFCAMALTLSAERTRLWSYLVCGLAIGIAVLLRPTYGVSLIPIAAVIWREPQRSRNYTIVGLGIAIPLVAGLWPYLTDAYRFSEFFKATFTFNTQVYGSADQRTSLVSSLTNPFELLSNVIFIAAAVALKRWNDENSTLSDRVRFGILALGTVLALKIMIYWMGKFFLYHYGSVFLILSPFLGYWLCRLTIRIQSPSGRKLMYLSYIFVYLALITIRSPLTVLALSDGSLNERLEKVDDKFGANRWSLIAERRALRDHVIRNTSPDDEIEFCSMDNDIVWFAERSQCSRWTLIHPLGMKVNDAFTKDQLRWRKEFVDTLSSRLPKLIMLNSEPEGFLTFLNDDPETILRGIPGFTELLDSRYEPDTVIGSWSVFRRKE